MAKKSWSDMMSNYRHNKQMRSKQARDIDIGPSKNVVDRMTDDESLKRKRRAGQYLGRMLK